MPSEYRVKQGDTLWSIAKKHNVSFQELKKANPQVKRPDQIRSGDKIVIPDNRLGNKEVGGDCEECEKTSCIKIILLHEDGHHYAGEACRIKQEKTLIWEGKLDGTSSVFLEKIRVGVYLVEFPKFNPENISSLKEHPFLSSVNQRVCGTPAKRFRNEFHQPFALRLFSDKTHTIIVQVKRELIIIVGAEDIYTNPANKMMFMAQAVRYLKTYHSSFDLTTVFYFRGTNTSDQVTAFEKAVQANGGMIEEAFSWEDIVTHINRTRVEINGRYFIKKVQVMNFFAHGGPGAIWLYHNEKLFFTREEAKSIKADVFARSGGKYPDVHVTSWACQTGNDARQLTVNENMAQSLAQIMADILQVKVYASAKRTDYEKTWDTGMSGLWDDFTETRRLIDGAVWESEGADNPIHPGESNSGSVTMPQGMFRFEPGRKENYQFIKLNY